MRLRDLPGWPPVWALAYTGAERFQAGEVGTLLAAEAVQYGEMLLITIDVNGQRTTGLLPIRPVLRDQVLLLLQWLRGRPLTEVGGVEIPRSKLGEVT